MDKKIIYQFAFISLFLILSVTIITLYHARTNTLKSAIHNAEVVSNVVKNGLTSYMINENMHEVDTFINSVSSMKNINNLWLVRGENVSSQFGEISTKKVKDNIDENVLKNGVMQYEISEEFLKTTMRITIPYKAILENGVDCLKCHNVSSGSTLGVISMELDITDLKEISLSNAYSIPLIILLSLATILLIFKKNFNTYDFAFANLTKTLNLALSGKYKKINYSKSMPRNIVNLLDNFNNLISTFRTTSYEIDKKLKGFIGAKSNVDNPLEDSRLMVTNLSNLYQYKKEIELDNSKEEIYNRLSEVFINQFGIKNFTIVEINITKKKKEIIIDNGKSFQCREFLNENPELCRAARTKNDVVSINYHHSCPYFKENDRFHYCISVEISKNVNLIINFVCDTNEELEQLKEQISYIKSYINESIPSIEVKLLMNALQESAFTDGLTGLYNRKFLDEHSKKLIPHAKRDNFNVGVLLLDMDHFKAVNDEYGHDIGDKVVRYGGEEFVILLVNIAEEEAIKVANKIKQKVSENEIDVYAGSKLKKTISIGLSMYPKDSSSFDSVIKNADIALYEAKHKGRNQVIRFKEEQVTSVELF
jgi:GGDEF domain-containing protein